MSMKKKLRKAYESAAPDVWGRVVQACSDQKLPPYEAAPSQRSVKGNLPNWLTETLGVTAAVALLICVIIGGAWFVSHYGLSPFEDNPPIQTSEPTETTLPSETTQPTQTSEPPETTTPDETTPDDTIPLQSTVINDYSHGLWQSAVYVEGRYDDKGWDIDGCVDSYLYCFDMKTGERTLICDEPVKSGLSCQTPDFIFYVTEANPRQMVCSLPDGSNQFVCYEAQYADITDITSVAPIGTLGILEGDQYLIQYNFESDASQLLMEYEYIGSFYLGILDHARVVEFKDAEGRYWAYYLDTKEIEESW